MHTPFFNGMTRFSSKLIALSLPVSITLSQPYRSNAEDFNTVKIINQMHIDLNVSIRFDKDFNNNLINHKIGPFGTVWRGCERSMLTGRSDKAKVIIEVPVDGYGSSSNAIVLYAAEVPITCGKGLVYVVKMDNYSPNRSKFVVVYEIPKAAEDSTFSEVARIPITDDLRMAIASRVYPDF